MNMQKFLREWRQDALNKTQYESAIFLGDKLLAMTNDDNDAFWLAQVHFATGNFTRAYSFLVKHDLMTRNPACRYLSAHCLIKQSLYDDALALLGERNPIHLITSSTTNKRNTAQPTTRSGKTAASSEAAANDRRYEAAMCHLRGLCYTKQNAFGKAKECYKAAVQIDVQCFEAFQQLVSNSIMSPAEEWAFLESLDFDSVRVPGDPAASQEAAEFTKMLYTTRLSKYNNPNEFTVAYESLTTHYKLGMNPDLLLARADLLYTQCKFADVLTITESIIREDRYNFTVYPLHLAALYQLHRNNELFLVSHDLADHYPDEPCTWLAVGTYYFAIGRIPEARRYFSKASMMDPHFAPAWIGFAHTFAEEGENDQAISAYSTAARLFMGTHLPQLFLGMQHHALSNMSVAEEFLKTAYGLCKSDPLLLNEMGVVKYHQDKIRDASLFFETALQLADKCGSEPDAWLSVRINLGHAYRRMRLYEEALECFNEAFRLGGKNSAIFTARGLIKLELGEADNAIIELHQALAINPQDAIATDLLNKALNESKITAMEAGARDGDYDVEFFDEEVVNKTAVGVSLSAAVSMGRRQAKKGKAKGRGRRQGMATGEDGSIMEMSEEEIS